MSNLKRNFAFIIFPFLLAIFLIMVCSGCASGYGGGDGLLGGFFKEGVYNRCGTKSSSVKGKVTTIDNVELKLPVDWGYASRHEGGSDFNGA